MFKIKIGVPGAFVTFFEYIQQSFQHPLLLHITFIITLTFLLLRFAWLDCILRYREET